MLTFIANITFLNDSISNVPIYSGYRPNFKFDNIENTCVDGAIFFNDYERIGKGEINKKVLLKIPRSDLYKKLIFEGLRLIHGNVIKPQQGIGRVLA